MSETKDKLEEGSKMSEQFRGGVTQKRRGSGEHHGLKKSIFTGDR